MSVTPREVFHGWRMVGVAFAMQAVGTGATLHAFGVFVKPVAEEFEASRLLTVLGPAAAALVGALVSPFLGRWLDRGAARVIIVTGALVMALGFGLLALAPSALLFGVTWATFVGLATVLLGPMTASKLVTSWFTRQRGRALGISTIGSSLGGFAFPPLAAWGIAVAGWRGAFFAFAVGVALVFAPCAWRFVVDRPERIGQHPDGLPVTTQAAIGGESSESADEREWTNREILRNANFWSITLSVGLVFGATGMIVMHLVPFATDQGISVTRAAWIQSTYAASAAAGKYFFGRIADSIPLRTAFISAIALQTIGWSGLLFDPGAGLLTAIAIALGLSAGGRLPVWSAMLAAVFGVRSFGRAMGLMGPMMLPVAFAGPPLAGYVHDRTGSYELGFQLGVVVLLAAIAAAFTLRLPKHAA